MLTYSASLDLDQPASTVWEYLIALEQQPLWEAALLEMRQVTPGEPVVGAAFEARRRYGRQEARHEAQIAAIEPGRSVTITQRGGPVTESRFTYAVDRLGDGRSRITYRTEAQLRGLARLLQPILPWVGRAEVRRNLTALERRIAAGIPPRSDTPTPDA